MKKKLLVLFLLMCSYNSIHTTTKLVIINMPTCFEFFSATAVIASAAYGSYHILDAIIQKPVYDNEEAINKNHKKQSIKKGVLSFTLASLISIYRGRIPTGFDSFLVYNALDVLIK